MTPETIEFLAPPNGEPCAAMLLFALRGVTRALEQRVVINDDDGDTIGDLAVAADCLAKLLVHRMTNCPARPVASTSA
jgi:hypothetical protein